MIRTLLLALALTSLSGCFISRKDLRPPLDPDKVAALRPGAMSAAEVVELLGAPTEVVQLGRRSAYRYDHVIEKQSALWLVVIGLRGVDTRSDRVWVFFDESDTLTHVGATLESDDAQYELPWLGEDD